MIEERRLVCLQISLGIDIVEKLSLGDKFQSDVAEIERGSFKKGIMKAGDHLQMPLKLVDVIQFYEVGMIQ